jgi:antitoxin component YwqK of YwqJK toxin-antitoxin module
MWKRVVVERYNLGGERCVIYHAQSNGTLVPMQQWILDESGRVIAISEVMSAHGEVIKHGVEIRSGPSGAILEHATYDHGLLEGDVTRYHTSGQIARITPFSRGKRSGKERTYDEAGHLLAEVPYVDDQIEGQALTYNPCGQLIKSIGYRASKPHGVAYTYEGDACISKMHFEDGALSSKENIHAIERYDLDGHLIYVQDFAHGKEHGLCIEYNKEGLVLHTVNYVEGKKEGRETFFSSSGEIIGGGEYRAGVAIGEHKRHLESGALVYFGSFDKEGVSLEPVCVYHEGGQLASKYMTSASGIEGELPAWDSEGRLRSIRTFKEGQLDGLHKEFSTEGVCTLEAYYSGSKLTGPLKTWIPTSSGPLLTLSCHYSNGQLDGNYQAWNEEGVLVTQTNYSAGQVDGTYESFYPNGGMKKKYTAGKGKLEGLYQEYCETGELLIEATYVNGEKSGFYKEWYPDGSKRIEGAFLHGRVDGAWLEWGKEGGIIASRYFRNGAPHGEQKTYFDGAQARLKSLSNYELGEPRGEHKVWHANGRLAEAVAYDHEGWRTGRAVRISDEGEIMEEFHYIDGRLDGAAKQLDPRTKRMWLQEYKQGLKHGRHEVRYPKEHPAVAPPYAIKATYVNGNLDGLYEQFSPKGVCLASILYAAGKREGMARLFTKSGAKRAEIPFRDDKREGVATEYHISGAVRLETVYISDQKEGVEKEYTPEGICIAERAYGAGKLHGALREYTEKGALICEAHFVHGEREGRFVKYYENGSPRVDQTFLSDKLHGIKKSYSKAGICSESMWEHGVKISQ